MEHHFSIVHEAVKLARWDHHRTTCTQTNEPKGADGLLENRKAFEYCLDRVGQAPSAGPLWLQYCSLLQRPRPGTTDFAALYGSPPAGQEEAARSAAVRWAPAAPGLRV